MLKYCFDIGIKIIVVLLFLHQISALVSHLYLLSPHQVFKYNSAIERHKVFISGLPFSCTKPQLEELCKSHGTVKDVRLVTYRSGKPKVKKPLTEQTKCRNHVF